MGGGINGINGISSDLSHHLRRQRAEPPAHSHDALGKTEDVRPMVCVGDAHGVAKSRYPW